ncbi:MAG TPA: DUF4397 domain-containing protein [Gemmatimonadales bacterium]|jgi:hypothetical protein|nr:DUF4397 domain-containing protein [Gemmatimonadales bacterium]
MTRHRAIAALLAAVALVSCDKDAVQDITGTPPGANIKFFHFGVGAPGVNFYADDTKVTAINSTTKVESTTGTTYGGVGAGGFYSALAPDQYSFTGRIAAATDKDLPIATVSTTLEQGKSYSFYLSGFYNTTAKSVDAFVLEDAYPAEIDWSQAYVRFVHAISNANPLTLYAKLQTTGVETALGAAVAYKQGGNFTALPAGVYDLGARYTGVATNAISRTAVSFVAGRVYTIGARGDITVTSSTATNRPFLDNTANR